MIGFPTLMYYMWLGATYYDGKPPTRRPGESWEHFLRHLGHLIYEGAFPSIKAWTMYWVFFVFQMLLYIFAPGVWTKGKPLAHEGGKRLDYYCSGLWSWWITIVLALGSHFTGVFKLDTIMDEFGPLMSVAIISGTLVSVVAYVSALYRGKQHRMTGHHIYDFFMGAELNPRMFGILDFKMFFEVRLPWFILFLLTLGACTRQYEQYGYVSGNLGILLLAHWLYANACSKGEECIVSTWDMYYEKWGFMLIFWNMAGVPLSYCHCTIYLANHDPKEYQWNRYAVVAMVVAYLFVYWVWDTANSQKNRFRFSEKEPLVDRKAFPQLPWGTLENPKTLTTPEGGTILVDGWCKSSHYAMPTPANFRRRKSQKDPLHLRLVLCSYVGRRHWFQFTLPLVLPSLLLRNDHPSCNPRYSKVQSEVWGDLAGVRETSPISVHSSKLNLWSNMQRLTSRST